MAPRLRWRRRHSKPPLGASGERDPTRSSTVSVKASQHGTPTRSTWRELGTCCEAQSKSGTPLMRSMHALARPALAAAFRHGPGPKRHCRGGCAVTLRRILLAAALLALGQP